MTYYHSLADRLFDVRRVAFCELVAWGIPMTQANALCGYAYDTSNAYRATKSERNARRIEGLKEKPPVSREWEYAFALLILNRWTAVDACKQLGQGDDCTDAALRQRASRAMKRPAVKFAIVHMSRNFRLTKRIAAYVERHEQEASAFWSKWNLKRVMLYGRIDLARALMREAYPARAEVMTPLSVTNSEPPKLRNANGKHICGAKTRSGNRGPCQRKPLPGKKRCALHGGLSTGPKTAAGKAKSSQNARRKIETVR